LLDRDVKRLWNTLFKATVLGCGQEKKTTVCLESVLRHRNSHTKNRTMLGRHPRTISAPGKSHTYSMCT
jgi:hypothetical protein